MGLVQALGTVYHKADSDKDITFINYITTMMVIIIHMISERQQHNWASLSEETCLGRLANSNGTEQPAH